MEPEIVHLKRIEALMQPLTQAVKSTGASVDRISNLDKMLERIAVAAESAAASNARIEQMMVLAWSTYDMIARQQKEKKQ